MMYFGHIAEELYYYDFNSEYPFVGCKPLPYDYPMRLKSNYPKH